MLPVLDGKGRPPFDVLDSSELPARFCAEQLAE